MKKSKKSRVSWPPDAILCQITVFQSEDCPAKVSLQPQTLENRKPPSARMRVPDLPPGFEGNHYVTKPRPSGIPRIKWKRPPKFTISDSWLVGGGEESTERQTENLRIAKVLEAIYPHRSAIPSRPSVSLDVEAERCDDSKTPLIRLTPIEDELDVNDESSQSAPESSIPAYPQGQLEPKTPGSNAGPAPSMVSGLGADMSMAAYAVLTALMKTKEPGSNIDPDLLVKFLSDPKMVQDLINYRISKPSELVSPPVVDTKTTPGLVSQHVTTSAPLPSPSHTSSNVVPLKPSFATSQPVTRPVLESRKVDLPMTNYGAESIEVSPPRYGNENPHAISVPGQSLAMELPKSKPAHLGQIVSSSTLPINGKTPDVSATPRLVSFSTLPVSAGPKPLQRTQPTFSTLPTSMSLVETPLSGTTVSNLNMNLVAGSAGLRAGQKPHPAFDLHPMNVNRVEVAARLNPSSSVPVKSVDYFKNLIREHGMVKAETREVTQPGNNNAWPENINVGKNVKHGEVKAKIQKPCMYFTSTRGCKLGDNCMYLHDHRPYRWRSGIAVEAPTAKRTKFASAER